MKEEPLITVVTPVYNAAKFLEQTIRSILQQNYPNLEYMIIDGGSTDGSIEIIKKHEKHLTWWQSEPDKGMYDAINKGFQNATGDIMAWSPANDLYAPDAFATVAEIFSTFPQILWLTSLYKVKIDEHGHETDQYKIAGFNKRAFNKGYNLLGSRSYAKYCIPQQSTFWRRSLWQKAGEYVNSAYQAAGDFDLWLRFFNYTDLYAVDQPLGIFRTHREQKSQQKNDTYARECYQAFEAEGGQLMGRKETWLRERLLRPLALRHRIFERLYFKSPIVKKNPSNGQWMVEKRAMF